MIKRSARIGLVAWEDMHTHSHVRRWMATIKKGKHSVQRASAEQLSRYNLRAVWPVVLNETGGAGIQEEQEERRRRKTVGVANEREV